MRVVPGKVKFYEKLEYDGGLISVMVLLSNNGVYWFELDGDDLLRIREKKLIDFLNEINKRYKSIK